MSRAPAVLFAPWPAGRPPLPPTHSRIDLGILRRMDQVWTSDNTDALDRLEIQHGFTQLYPPLVLGAWVTDSPNPYTGALIHLIRERPAPRESR
jgi:melibiase-like protein